VSSRKAEKERARRDRLAREREHAAAERRSRIRRVVGGVVFIALAAVALGAVVKFSGNQAEAGGPFGQHYRGLQERREAAGVPTMAEADPKVHIHPKLSVYVNGSPIEVPANIGIDPARDSSQMAGLHTHDAEGTIHVEGAPGTTLGQFFQIWGVPFSATRLGPNRAGRGRKVKMWVDGRPSQAFGSLKFADKQQIVVGFGPANAPMPGG
jgi:hypothetical protein